MKKKLLTALTLASCTCACTAPVFGLTSCKKQYSINIRMSFTPVERTYRFHFPDWSENGELDPESSEEDVYLGDARIINEPNKPYTDGCKIRVSSKSRLPEWLIIRNDENEDWVSFSGDWQHCNVAVARDPIEIYFEYNTDENNWFYPTHGWVEWPEPLIIPAYDGSVTIRSDQEAGWHYLPWGIDTPNELLRQKFNLNYPNDKICLGIWRIDKHPDGKHIVWNNDYAKSRVIPISSFEYLEPDNPRYKVEAINDNAFNLEIDNDDMGFNDPGFGRTLACEDFRNFFFGTQEEPETGFWKEIRFEGYMTPLEKIGDHAFYHCWSLESSLVTYYGLDEAHNMVYNGTHS